MNNETVVKALTQTADDMSKNGNHTDSILLSNLALRLTFAKRDNSKLRTMECIGLYANELNQNGRKTLGGQLVKVAQEMASMPFDDDEIVPMANEQDDTLEHLLESVGAIRDHAFDHLAQHGHHLDPDSKERLYSVIALTNDHEADYDDHMSKQIQNT